MKVESHVKYRYVHFFPHGKCGAPFMLFKIKYTITDTQISMTTLLNAGYTYKKGLRPKKVENTCFASCLVIRLI